MEGRTAAGILGLALLAMLLGWVATPFGPGITPDAVLYLEAAGALRSRGEFPTSLNGGVRGGDEIPPLYPLALAVVGADLDHTGPARWLNVLLYGLNVALFGAMAHQLTRRNRFTTLAGGALAATSLVLLEIHTAAWSEPLFLLLMLGWNWALANYLEKPKLPNLILAGILVGLSPLCRFAGVTSIAASVLALLLLGRRRWSHIALFAVIAAAPLVALLRWQHLRSGGSAGSRSPSFHWPGADIEVLWNTMAAWVVPGIDRFRVVPAQDAIALGFVLAWIALLGAGLRRQESRKLDFLFGTVVVHTVTYPLVILAIVTFVKPDLPLEQRIMAPMHVTLLLVTLTVLSGWKNSTLRALTCLWMVVYLVPALVGVRIMALQGRGYLGPSYQAPGIYAKLRELNPSMIRSNDLAAAWLLVRLPLTGLGSKAKAPVLFFRVNHPLPPTHQAGRKRPDVEDAPLSRAIEETPLHLEAREGLVELYLPDE